MKRIQPEQSLSALPNLVPEDSFCCSGEEGGEKEEVEEWADVDLDLDLWHLDLEEVGGWGIGEVGVHAMETECHHQAPANGSISLPMRMPRGSGTLRQTRIFLYKGLRGLRLLGPSVHVGSE